MSFNVSVDVDSAWSSPCEAFKGVENPNANVDKVPYSNVSVEKHPEALSGVELIRMLESGQGTCLALHEAN